MTNDNHRGAIVHSNDRGTLERVGGMGSSCRWVGSKRLDNGQYTTKHFMGSREDVVGRWLKWQKRKPSKAATQGMTVTRIEEPREEAKEEEVTKMEERKCDTVYVLRFINGRNSKDIAAYRDQDAALNQATDLKAALDFSNSDGDFDVEEVELR